MDPLSITAAIVGIGAVATSTSNAFTDLRTLCKSLPGRLHAVSNEVADFELVLNEVAALIEERSGKAVLEQQEVHIRHLLDQAGSKLNELRAVVKSLTTIVRKSKVPIFRAHAWRKNQPQLQALQEDIKTIKCSLNILIGTSNSRDMTRIRVDLERITSFSSDSAGQQVQMEANLQGSLVRHRDDLEGSMADFYRQVDQRIGSVEGILKIYHNRLQASQSEQLDASDEKALPSYSRSNTRKPTQHVVGVNNSGDIGVRVAQYAACPPGCICRCHIQKRNSTSGLVDRVFGQMFVGYTGLPLVNSKCSLETCERNQPASINVEYWFPLGFLWSSIVRLQLSYRPNIGPQFELSTHRRVPDSAHCVKYALTGDIEGLKDLFRRGLASPRDVSSTRGYSVLRWAMYGKQYQACKFLLHAGADPDYRPIAASDNSPRNKAHHQLLMGNLSEPDIEALRCITQDDDFVSEQNYTTLHKIIIGLSGANLEEELLLHPEDINARDAMGRTPLAWAACRGDDRAIVTLLTHGAEPNTLDVQHSAPVCHSADRNLPICVRLLLEAGADPNIAANHGYRIGDGLNTAARNAFDPVILKSLLDFGANVESCGVDGMTPLIHAARRDYANFAVLLLEYGANINATNSAGQTPLTIAITYNSHSVLRLLLDRWFEYSGCPRLKGPHLLQIVVAYADIETIAMLRDTDHLKLKYDEKYTLSDFATRLSHRVDLSEKLVSAFNELLEVIKKGPAPPPPEFRDELRSMEAGLMGLEDNEIEDIFENALENL